MSGTVSRVLVAIVGLPVVLGAVWAGAGGSSRSSPCRADRGARVRDDGSAAAAAHAGGYIGTVLALLGAEKGGLRGCSAASSRASSSRSRSTPCRRRAAGDSIRRSTVLGAAWIGFGLAHLILLRRMHDEPRVLAFAVLLTVFAADTFAYFGGRLHRAAQDVADAFAGQDVGGFLHRLARRHLRRVRRALPDRDHYLVIWQAARARRSSSSLAAAARRPVRVDAEARHAGEGHGPPPRRPRRRPRSGRRPALRSVAAFYVVLAFLRIRVAWFSPLTLHLMHETRRAAGRHRLDRPPGDRDRRGAPGARALRGRVRLDAARRTSTRRSSRSAATSPSCSTGPQPDVVLNAVVGFAGIHATLWAIEHGVDLALANKESLVAAGELATAAQARGGGRTLPVDSEHSALFQCLEGARAGAGAHARPHGLRRPLPRPHARRAAQRHARARRSHIRPGAWARRSRSTPPRSRTRGSS